ncbi:DUF6177 family protein [Streptomyces sp. NPDC101194]|uniref:DUF6177 family protein n=1 Tax=Streptomyces sp. NPDC101194 TaxID=3366127 RepID=UPI00381C2C56
MLPSCGTEGGSVRGSPSRPQEQRTRAGVEENITLAMGHGACQSIQVDALPELDKSLATGHNLTRLAAPPADQRPSERRPTEGMSRVSTTCVEDVTVERGR